MYEIHIGETFNIDNASAKLPLKRIIITDEQFAILEAFASQRRDEHLNIIYKLNDCEFRIYPHISETKEAMPNSS